MVCCFFGHREIHTDIGELLYQQIERQIQKGVSHFPAGNQGTFDALVLHELRKLKAVYGFVEYKVVLAYLPGKTNSLEYWETLLP